MMKALRKIRNTVTELRLWRAERRKMMQENANLREELDTALAGERSANEMYDAEKQLRDLADDALDSTLGELKRISKELEETQAELQMVRDLTDCLLTDWGKMFAECSELRAKVGKQEDNNVRLWVERELLLAALLKIDAGEALRFHV